MMENQPEVTLMSFEEFAQQKSDEWYDNIISLPPMSSMSAEKQDTLRETLHALCVDLVDELSPNIINMMPVDTIKAFLIAVTRGYSLEKVIHAYLCSPTNPEAFKVIKSIYHPDPSHSLKPELRVVH